MQLLMQCILMLIFLLMAFQLAVCTQSPTGCLLIWISFRSRLLCSTLFTRCNLCNISRDNRPQIIRNEYGVLQLLYQHIKTTIPNFQIKSTDWFLYYGNVPIKLLIDSKYFEVLMISLETLQDSMKRSIEL